MLCVAAFALPASAAYTYEDTELGFSLTLPDEFDGVIELREGIDFTGAAGSDGATLYYLPAVEAGSEGTLGYIAVVPKQDRIWRRLVQRPHDRPDSSRRWR